jgi:hypothetical protein
MDVRGYIFPGQKLIPKENILTDDGCNISTSLVGKRDTSRKNVLLLGYNNFASTLMLPITSFYIMPYIS